MAEPASRRKAFVERWWIVTFIVLGFLFAVLAPWFAALPLVLFSSGLGVLDGYAHRALLGWQWAVAPCVFGVLWLAFAIGGAVRGGSGLLLFGP